MKVVLRFLITAAAVAVATALVPGIELRAASTTEKVVTLIVVALIFGLVNTVLKPIVKIIGCLFYVLTLGLIGLVVNGLLFWLTSWVAGKLKLPFHITGFWPAFWGPSSSESSAGCSGCSCTTTGGPVVRSADRDRIASRGAAPSVRIPQSAAAPRTISG